MANRLALIIAVDRYDSGALAQLASPVADAQALAEVLADPDIGGFDVSTLHNPTSWAAYERIENLLADRRSTDLVLLHFSGHGLKDPVGELYLAATNTVPDRLASTAVEAVWINRVMQRSRAERVVLLLDCCYGGAFERGVVARAGAAVDVGDQFRQTSLDEGRGRVVITASTAVEYAFEGERLSADEPITPSAFTGAVVEGIRSGEADRDDDGRIALGELYDYVHDRVRDRSPRQTPSKWEFGRRGEIYIARNPRHRVKPAPPPQVPSPAPELPAPAPESPTPAPEPPTPAPELPAPAFDLPATPPAPPVADAEPAAPASAIPVSRQPTVAILAAVLVIVVVAAGIAFARWYRREPTPPSTLPGVNSVAFSPDGVTIAVGANNGVLRLWKPSTGEATPLTGHTQNVESVAFNLGGGLLASAGGDRTVRLWSPSTGGVSVLTGHTDLVGEVAFSPDGTSLAAAGYDHTVRGVELADKGQQGASRAHEHRLECRVQPGRQEHRVRRERFPCPVVEPGHRGEHRRPRTQREDRDEPGLHP